jgi:hypothetical protein
LGKTHESVDFFGYPQKKAHIKVNIIIIMGQNWTKKSGDSGTRKRTGALAYLPAVAYIRPDRQPVLT